MDVLIDTSVWSLVLRRREENLNGDERRLVDEVRELIGSGRIAMIGPVRQELLTGIRDRATFERLRRRLGPYPDLPLSTEDYEEAARLSNLCLASGIAVGAVDLLICAAAIRRNLLVFTTDGDFHLYASVLPLQLHTPAQDAS